MSDLEPAARALLAVVAVAGGPIGQGVAARAADLAAVDYLAQLETLRAGQLVRISGTRRDDTVEPYHDRIRETVYERLGAGGRVRLHRRLGLLLEEAGASADCSSATSRRRASARRPRGTRTGGGGGGAARWRSIAPRSCIAAPLDLGRHDRPRARAPHDRARRRAHQRGTPAGGGRGVPGGGGDPGGAERDELVDLHRRATEQLLMGGHLEAGLDADAGAARPPRPHLSREQRGRHVPAGVATGPPGGAAVALAPRPESELPADERNLLDVYWSVGAGLGLVDTMRGVLFSFGGALAALEAATRRASPARWRPPPSPRRDWAATGARTASSTPRAAPPSRTAAIAPASTVSWRAGHRLPLDNDWRACLAGIDQAMRLWRAAGHTAAGWEWDAAEQFACWSLDNLGRLRDVCERVPARIRAAQRAGNRFMEVNFRSFFANVYLRRR